MCSIFILEPGQMIDHNKLDNVIANNLDGYGIILQDPNTKTLEVVRSYTQGGTRTEDVQQILEFNKDKRRFVHVRNQTAGILNEDNVHPFKVFQSEGRDVWMMHNGTINDFKPKTGDNRSDTRIFGDQFVSKLLANYSGEFGYGDYNDPQVQEILAKFAGTGYVNRLLFVSNDLEPLMLGQWSKIKNADGSEFVASNDSYFNSIVRGPRKTVVPFQASGNRWNPSTGASGSQTTTGSTASSQVTTSQTTTQLQKAEETKREVVSLTDAGLNAKLNEYNPPEKVLDAIDGWYEDFGLYAVTWLKYSEVVKLVRDLNADEIAALLLNLSETLNQMESDLDVAEQQLKKEAPDELEDRDLVDDLKAELEVVSYKHEKSTQRNAQFALENQQLRAENNRLLLQIATMEAMMNGEYTKAA